MSSVTGLPGAHCTRRASAWMLVAFPAFVENTSFQPLLRGEALWIGRHSAHQNLKSQSTTQEQKLRHPACRSQSDRTPIKIVVESKPSTSGRPRRTNSLGTVAAIQGTATVKTGQRLTYFRRADQGFKSGLPNTVTLLPSSSRTSFLFSQLAYSRSESVLAFTLDTGSSIIDDCRLSGS